MHTKHVLITGAALLASTGLAACGSSGGDSSTSTPAAATTTTTAAAAPAPAAAAATDATGGKVTVDATEYAFAPKAITAKAGKLTLTLDNKGGIQHELVLLKTSSAPDALKVNASTARVSETGSVGEVSELDAGKTASHTFDLKPGTYVYVCNIPTHYMSGMRGLLTVK